jgi:PmbA protein
VSAELSQPTSPDRSLDELANLASDVLARCRKLGATQAELSLNLDAGLNVNVRMGEVETVEHTRDRGIALSVYFGKRKGSASTADVRAESISTTIEQACAIARHTEEDACSGLADAERMATFFPDLDQWHPWALDATRAIELGIAAEAAGRALDPRLHNSDGASVATGTSVALYANSHGFFGRESGTRHSISCSLLGEDDSGMQRDYWYTTGVAVEDLESAEAVGRRAGERTLARLSPRKIATQECAVLFVPDVARSLIGHLVGAVSGGALYRRASFLLDSLGQSLFPAWFNIIEQPHLKRGAGSSAFDAEGVATIDRDLVRDGVLARYILGSYSARKLGLQSTGNAGGIHNLVLSANAGDFADMLKRLGTGFLVTELMGQGVNTVTGDYSRGATGFWVEDGVIAYPVDEVTIAGHLRDMFQRIVAVGSDIDTRGSIRTGSILLERMMVAGQ